MLHQTHLVALLMCSLVMQPEEEPEELIAARNKLESASLAQQENEPAGKTQAEIMSLQSQVMQCLLRGLALHRNSVFATFSACHTAITG